MVPVSTRRRELKLIFAFSSPRHPDVRDPLTSDLESEVSSEEDDSSDDGEEEAPTCVIPFDACPSEWREVVARVVKEGRINKSVRLRLFCLLSFTLPLTMTFYLLQQEARSEYKVSERELLTIKEERVMFVPAFFTFSLFVANP